MEIAVGVEFPTDAQTSLPAKPQIDPPANAQAEFYINEYRQGNHNEHTLALLEERIWTSLPPEQRRHVDRSRWLSDALDSSINQMQNRSSLRNKKDVDPFWERVNSGGMTVGTALRLYKDALQIHVDRKILLSHAIARTLEEYDELPHVSTRHGRPVRQSSSVRLPRESKKQKKKTDKNSARDKWDKLRESVATLIRDKLPENLEPDIESALWKEIELDIKIVLKDLQFKITRLHNKKKNNQQTAKTASRRQLVAACRVLAMDPPRTSKPVDLSKAKRQMRLLAKQYHPDARDGDDSLVAQYDAVIDAYRTIQWYADQFN